MKSKKALILVDIQNDFLPGGALAVPHGDEVVGVANEMVRRGGFEIIVATQDFHPPNHGSFAANNPGRKVGEMAELGGLPQVMWPIHCVEYTRGSEFAAGLDMVGVDKIFHKGLDSQIDSYSGFYDNGHKKSTGMGEYLKAEGVTDVVVLGLATDYCVKFTALDALKLGFKTTLITDGSRAVNLQPQDGEKAIAEVRAAGGHIATSKEYL